MGSNVGTVGSMGGVLLGRYGLFAAKYAGNSNVTPIWTTITPGAASSTLQAGSQGMMGNVIPANLSTAQAPGLGVTNGNYAGQGITGAFDSGPLFFQVASGWTKWGVMARSDIPGNPINGLSATVYGTWDQDTADGTLTTYNANGIVTSSANSNWYQAVTPSTESSGDTAVWSNPLTALGQAFWSNTHYLAIRINVSALVSGSVLFVIYAEA